MGARKPRKKGRSRQGRRPIKADMVAATSLSPGLSVETILQELEALAERLGIVVRYGRLEGPGGSCRFNHKHQIIVNRAARPEERITLLARELGKLPLDDLYLIPQIRELLEAESQFYSSSELES